METSKYFIYQTFPRLFGNFIEHPVRNGDKEENGCGTFDSYTTTALESIKALGITHIWYTGVIAHATCTDYTAFGIPKDHRATVKGKAGSPYAISDYYDVDPDLATVVPNRMNEFKALVKRTHDAGMKVIIDFVPNHVSRNYRSLKKPGYVENLGAHDQTELAFSPTNNFYYLPGQCLELHFGAQEEDFEYNEFPAKATGNDCFTATPGACDWYETIKLNYGVDYLGGGSQHFDPIPDTWHKMLHILHFWLETDIDGFRCDMAEMVPVAFWNWVIPRVKSRKDVLFIAEIYNPSAYEVYLHSGHFDFLYDKVGTYDILRNLIGRKTTVLSLNQHLHKVRPIADRLLFFLENHDEQRIASDFFAGDALAAIPAFIFMATCGNHPVLLYNGQEFGEAGMDDEGFSGVDGRTTIFDYWRMDSIRRWANNGRFDGGLLSINQTIIYSLYKKIIHLAGTENAFVKGRYYGLDEWNYDNPFFPSERMSAWLRVSEKEVILVCINFDDQARQFRLNIPKNAFEVLQIPDNTASRKQDLLSGKESITALTHTCPFQGVLPALSAKILKFNYFSAC